MRHSESESLGGEGEKRLGRSMTPQFRVLGGSCPRHDETVETLFPVIFLGRAAENNVGPGGRVHDMRTMWSPYDQSCNLGGPWPNFFTGGSAQIR